MDTDDLSQAEEEKARILRHIARIMAGKFLYRARDVFRREGLLELIRRIPRFIYHRSLRRVLPTTSYQTRNGVKSLPRKPLDNVWPFSYPDDNPDYEVALISALRWRAQEGDRVGIIGGGNGISTVVAAKISGGDGDVTVYEGSEQRVSIIERTIEINDVADQTTVKHSLVGPGKNVYGDASDADLVAPQDLPSFDILEIDCEGAEKKILSELKQWPQCIIVEVHPPIVSRKDIEQILKEQGYEISSIGYENELPVITAIKE